jgi:hypothetical protein
MSVLVKVASLADGGKTPHDGRYLRRWNPHTEFGTCEIDTTASRAKAKRFADAGEVLAQWKTVSRAQTFRPDGNLNRPLTGLTIEIVKENEA